jgi:hypothetical protein
MIKMTTAMQFYSKNLLGSIVIENNICTSPYRFVVILSKSNISPFLLPLFQVTVHFWDKTTAKAHLLYCQKHYNLALF